MSPTMTPSSAERSFTHNSTQLSTSEAAAVPTGQHKKAGGHSVQHTPLPYHIATGSAITKKQVHACKYSPEKHHSSDDVYWTGAGEGQCVSVGASFRVLCILYGLLSQRFSHGTSETRQSM